MEPEIICRTGRSSRLQAVFAVEVFTRHSTEVGCATRQVARHDLSITLQQLAHLHASRHITVRELFISLLDTVLLTYHNSVPC